MTRALDWIDKFFEAVLEAIPRLDWPSPSSRFWDIVERGLDRHGVSERVAYRALDLLAEEPPFPDGLLKGLLNCARHVWASSEVGPTGPDSREAAEAAAAGCADCAATGFTIRYRQKSAEPGRTSIVLYCLCPMGRWIERAHREASPTVRRRFRDLADFPWLQDERYKIPPGLPAEAVRMIEAEDMERLAHNLGLDREGAVF